MNTFFKCIEYAILRNPISKSWKFELFKPILATGTTGVWRIKYSNTRSVKNHTAIIQKSDINLSVIADTFKGSGLITNVRFETNKRLQRDVYTIHITQTNHNKKFIDTRWFTLWSLVKHIRLQNEVKRLNSIIIHTLKQTPHASLWEISLSSSLNLSTEILSKVKHNIQLEGLDASYYYKSQNSSLMIFKIERKQSFTYLQHISILNKSIEEQFPEIICPISLQIMKNPVLLGNTGHTYEYDYINRALARRPNKDPLSNSSISNSTLTPNYALKAIIEKINNKKYHSAASIFNF